MIIISTQNSYDWSRAHVYNIAEQDVLFQTPCPALNNFIVEEASLELLAEASLVVQENFDRDFNSAEMPVLYRGPAPFGNRERDVQYRRAGNLAAIELDGELVCEIDFSANHIHLLREGDFKNMVNVELVTGPAMVLMLSIVKVYCLHASAVATPSGVIAITGESGVGKSTLAWQAGHAWQQLADDIVPILYDKDEVKSKVNLTKNFPQLKLDGSIAPGECEDIQKLDFILRINPKPSKEVSFKALNRTDATLQFVRHTVGARLFDSRAMTRHLKFAKYISGKIPMIEVSYPRDLLQLGDLREEIISYLADFKVTR